jgi:hypothetical protein
LRQAAKPGGQLERFITAPAEGELVPVAVRNGVPLMLGTPAVQRWRADAQAGATLDSARSAGDWHAQAQEALDRGTRVRAAGGRSAYVLALPDDQVVLLEVEAVRDANGARVLRLHSLRVLTFAQATAEPEAQQLLQLAGLAGRGG